MILSVASTLALLLFIKFILNKTYRR
jgi:hypothetical protein